MKAAATAAQDVPDETISGYAVLAWTFAFVAVALDAFDWVSLANVAPMIGKEFGLSPSRLGFLLGAPLLGAGVGGIVSGWISDKIGRVKTMALCIFWFSIFTVFFPSCRSFESMLVFRILSGIGLGAQWGVGNTLTAEWLPAKKRVLGTAVNQSGSCVGIIAAALITMWFAPRWGWRPIFYVGAVGFVLALLALLLLKESDAWLVARGRHAAGEIRLGNIGTFFETPYLKRTILILITCIAGLMGYWATSSWIPTWLLKERHMDIVKSMSFMLLWGVGGGIGQLLFGLNSWRWGRKRPAYVVLVCSMPAAILFATAPTQTSLIIWTLIFAFFSGQILALLGGYIAELFPTQIRGTAVSGIYNIGRCITFFGPFLLAAIAKSTSMTFAIGLSAALYGIALIPLLFLPETKGVRV
jgi:MFS transporter, AAHS family, cis,cis-muconate transporter